jgi:hypothetical protein
MDGKKAGAIVHAAPGQHHFEVTGQLKPLETGR